MASGSGRRAEAQVQQTRTGSLTSHKGASSILCGRRSRRKKSVKRSPASGWRYGPTGQLSNYGLTGIICTSGTNVWPGAPLPRGFLYAGSSQAPASCLERGYLPGRNQPLHQQLAPAVSGHHGEPDTRLAASRRVPPLAAVATTQSVVGATQAPLSWPGHLHDRAGRWLQPSVAQPQFLRPQDRLGTAFDAQLGVDPLGMGLHRVQ